MHLTPEQEADEQALRDKETGAELEVVNKVDCWVWQHQI